MIGAQFLLYEENERILKLALELIHIRQEITRYVASINAHSINVIHLRLECLTFFYIHNSI